MNRNSQRNYCESFSNKRFFKKTNTYFLISVNIFQILDAILYHGETWELMGRRWGKIEKDFYTKNKIFDISKIPDIYDCIKYDLQHNQHTLQFEQAEELYIYAKYLADVVIPQVRKSTVFKLFIYNKND